MAFIGAHKPLFEYDKYQLYLLDRVGPRGTRRGGRSVLAKAMDVQTSYLSRVLSGQQELSLEQAHRANQVLQHSEDESDFFLLLVSLARSGDKSLRDHYKKKILQIREKREHIQNRLSSAQTLSDIQKSEYYSAWFYAAVHSLVATKDYATKERISEYLNLPMATVHSVLSFLIESGLIEEHRGRFRAGKFHVHLGDDFYMIRQHHTGWRLQAVDSLSRYKTNDLHYSAAVTVDLEAAKALRKALLSLVDEAVKIITPAEEKELYCLNLDLFSMDKR